MAPIEFSLGRNPEADYQRQTEILTQNGWVQVTEPVHKIQTSWFSRKTVTPEMGTLFKKTESAKLNFREQLASGKRTLFTSPYIFLLKKGMREGLNVHVAGKLVPVLKFE